MLNNSNPRQNNPVIYLVPVRAYSTKELQALYQVSSKTLLRWLKPFSQEIGKKRGRYYNVLQVETIFLKCGVPYVLREEA